MILIIQIFSKLFYFWNFPTMNKSYVICRIKKNTKYDIFVKSKIVLNV